MLIDDVHGLIRMLVAIHGRREGHQLFLRAVKSLSAEELAAFEIASQIEEEAEVRHVARGLRVAVRRSLESAKRRAFEREHRKSLKHQA